MSEGVNSGSSSKRSRLYSRSLYPSSQHFACAMILSSCTVSVISCALALMFDSVIAEVQGCEASRGAVCQPARGDDGAKEGFVQPDEDEVGGLEVSLLQQRLSVGHGGQEDLGNDRLATGLGKAEGRVEETEKKSDVETMQSSAVVSGSMENHTNRVRRVCIEHRAGFSIVFWLTRAGTTLAGPQSPRFTSGFTKCLDAVEVPKMRAGNLIVAFFTGNAQNKAQQLKPSFEYSPVGATATFRCTGSVNHWNCPYRIE